MNFNKRTRSTFWQVADFSDAGLGLKPNIQGNKITVSAKKVIQKVAQPKKNQDLQKISALLTGFQIKCHQMSLPRKSRQFAIDFLPQALKIPEWNKQLVEKIRQSKAKISTDLNKANAKYQLLLAEYQVTLNQVSRIRDQNHALRVNMEQLLSNSKKQMHLAAQKQKHYRAQIEYLRKKVDNFQLNTNSIQLAKRDVLLDMDQQKSHQVQLFQQQILQLRSIKARLEMSLKNEQGNVQQLRKTLQRQSTQKESLELKLRKQKIASQQGRTKTAQLQSELVKLKIKKDQLQNSMREKSAVQSFSVNQSSLLRQKLSIAQKQIKKNKRQLQQYKLKTQNDQQQIKSASSQIAKLNQQIKGDQQQFQQMKNSLQTQIQNATLIITNLQLQLQNVKQQQAQLNRRLAFERSQVQTISSTLIAAESQYQQRTKLLEQRLNNQQDHIIKLGHEMQGLRIQLHILRQEQFAHISKIGQLNEKLAIIQQQLKQEQLQIIQKQAYNQRQQKELAFLKSELQQSLLQKNVLLERIQNKEQTDM